MATGKAGGVTLELTRREAEDLRGLLWANVSGPASGELLDIGNALAEINVNGTDFRTRVSPAGTLVLEGRQGVIEF
jgi:hypothetical protein